VRILLEKGETRPFDPFDRFAQLNLNRENSLEQLLDDFACLRRDNLAALTALNLQQESLNRRGKHPALGVVTLSELLATEWTVPAAFIRTFCRLKSGIPNWFQDKHPSLIWPSHLR
jgi:hypothetical protein